MRERAILTQRETARQFVLRFSRYVGRLLRRGWRRGIDATLAFARGTNQPGGGRPPSHVACRSAGKTTAVAVCQEFVEKFPLERYESHLSHSVARHSSVMHRCRVDRELTALVCGVHLEDDPGTVLIYRVGAKDRPRATDRHTAVNRERRQSRTMPTPPHSPTVRSSVV
jgi:hypothetical protein